MTVTKSCTTEVVMSRYTSAHANVLRFRFVWIIAVALLLGATVLYGISSTNSIDESSDGLARTIEPPAGGGASVETVGVKVNASKAVSYKEVSFRYNTSLASEVKAETIPASPLTDKTHKPDYVVPEHIAFTFIGTYSSQHESSFFQPKISIYPVAEYRLALSKSSEYAQSFDSDIRLLKSLLAEQPTSWNGEIPLLPFGIDSPQVLRARVRYADFRNGKGVLFLTQYNINPSLINNQGLTYVFQGMTNDNLFYVSAIFPVNLPSLPQGYDVRSSEDYDLEHDLVMLDRRMFDRRYKNYLTNVERELNGMQPDQYDPSLTLLYELISSIEVRNIK